MATKIVTKNSSTASAVPTASDLVQGELAVNVADKKLFTEDNSGAIIELADGVKLAGIEASADVTDTANVTAAGALMDSELTSEASVKALNQGVATTDSPAFAGGTYTGTLNVTPTSGFANIEVGGVDGAFIDLKSPSSDDYDMRLITSGGSGGTIDVGAAGDLSLRAGGSERVTLLSAGNVGIGTASPTSKLHLYKTGTSDNKLTIQNGQDAYASILDLRANNDGGAIYNSLTSTTNGGTQHWKIWGGAASSTMAFSTGASERMRIDSSGQVGIGTSSPVTDLDVRNNISMGDGTSVTNLSMTRNSANYITASNATGYLAFRTGGSTERMRIDSYGNVYMAATNAGVTSGGFAFVTGSVDYQMIGHATGTPTGNYYIGFRYGSNTIGAIVQNGTTGIAYNTSSDQRLKENIADADDAGSKIDAIQVRQYDWKADGSHQDYGVVAQELVEIAPEAVTVPADSEEMMGVDYSKLVPMLIKEIQSLRNRVAQLEE